MTAAQKNAIQVGVKTAIIAGGLIGLLSLTRDNIIFRPEFQAHVQQKEAQFEAVMDILCSDHPNHRRCK